MRLIEHKTKLLLITLAIAVAFTLLFLVKIFYEVIVPLFPQLSELAGPPIVAEPPPNTPSLVFAILYNFSPYLASIAWAAFMLVLWKSKLRKVWMQKGYDHDIFKIFVKKRGSDTRVKILKSLQIPKNRLQLAKELDMHWESIDGHIDLLIRYSLVKDIITFGTARYLMITDKGKEVLELLENNKKDSI